MTGAPVLERAAAAVAVLDPAGLAALASPGLRVAAPFDDLAAPGDLAVAGVRELELLCRRIAEATDGTLREVGRALSGEAAVLELEDGRGRPVTAVLLATGGRLAELRVYLDPAGGAA